jgi:DNA-binding helix-hairpin-helix protein with protein kinase domain
MTTAPPDVAQLTVAESALGPRVELARGANGRIYRLKRYRLPGEDGEIVYKEYRRETTSVGLPGLLSIVRAPLTVAPTPRAAFDDMTAWPLRVVVDPAGQPLGVLMRLIPAPFMERILLPSKRFERIPREVQHLIFEPAIARMRRVDVPADRDQRSRLRICAQLAYILAALHGAHLVYGDLSARNVLYALRPAPSVLLVDCDAVRIRGSAAVHKQQDSPDWDPPETLAARRQGRVPSQTQETDRYKLALFVLRCLRPGRDSSTNRDPVAAYGILDAAGRDLLERAVLGPKDDRPRAVEWYRYLGGVLGDPQPVRQTPVAQPDPVRPAGDAVQASGWRKDGSGAWVPQ